MGRIFKGSELQYKKQDGTWVDCYNSSEYRTKPKTVKFRNYLTAQNLPGIIFDNHPKDIKPLNFKKWLGDWQEVEVESCQQWPSELVERIAEIDLDAAEWLRDNLGNLKDYRSISGADINKVRRLFDLMCFTSTPQGRSYWRRIARKLGEA